MDQKGTKSVTVKITGNEKLRATVMLAVLADGRIFHSEIRCISVYICLLYTSVCVCASVRVRVHVSACVRVC